MYGRKNEIHHPIQRAPSKLEKVPRTARPEQQGETAAKTGKTSLQERSSSISQLADPLDWSRGQQRCGLVWSLQDSRSLNSSASIQQQSSTHSCTRNRGLQDGMKLQSSSSLPRTAGICSSTGWSAKVDTRTTTAAAAPGLPGDCIDTRGSSRGTRKQQHPTAEGRE